MKAIAPIFLPLLAAAVFCGCQCVSPTTQGDFSRFAGWENFSNFARSKNENGQTVLLSPKIKARIPWNELIVSWNADAPAGTFLKLEAAAVLSDHQTDRKNVV